MRIRLLFLLLIFAHPIYSLSPTPIATSLSNPVGLAIQDDRIYVVLQAGKIVVPGEKKPFLDISKQVKSAGEQGLLGLAFHPKFKENGFFFVNYTDKRGDTVVAKYGPGGAKKILTIHQPYSNHNGGHLAFGPDGFLYIGLGDGGGAGDPRNNAQNLNSLLGKMLRIDVDNGDAYAIPNDNPFIHKPNTWPEIWAYGLRNPWRYSFDRLTGDLYIADVGQNQWEEVSFQPAKSRGGENYGWRMREGSHAFHPDTNPKTGLIEPILEYDHDQGCSITGGFVYRGNDIPELQGTYLYADYCSGTIWGAKRDGMGKWKTQVLLKTSFNISTFAEDADGEIYFCHHHPKNGGVYKISKQ